MLAGVAGSFFVALGVVMAPEALPNGDVASGGIAAALLAAGGFFIQLARQSQPHSSEEGEK